MPAALTQPSGHYLLRALRQRATAVSALGVGLAAFGFYVLTLAPGLTWSNAAADGGDLLAAAFTWGVPHPTGYPTYLILLRGFAVIAPLGDEAFRGNLMSAAFAAAAVSLLFVATVRVLSTPARADAAPRAVVLLAAGVASAALAASRELWSQATVAEVYALNSFFVSALFLAAVVLRERLRSGGNHPVFTAATGAALGLGLGNHFTLLAVAAPMLAWAYLGAGARGALNPRLIWPLAAGLAAGLSVYLYAPIASAGSPAVNWGHPDTIAGFWWMVSGTIYQGYAFGVPAEDILPRLVTAADFLLAQYTVVGLAIGLIGLSWLWDARRSLVVSNLLSTILIVGYTVTYHTIDTFIYLIPVFMIFSVWLAAGLVVVFTGARKLAADSRAGRGPLARVGPGMATGVLAVAALAVIPGFSVATNLSDLDLSGDREAIRFAESTIETVGPGAVIFARSAETVFSLWYQAYVPDREEDVMVVSVPHLQFDWYWEDLQAQFPERMPAESPASHSQRAQWIIDENLGVRPVFDADPKRARVLLPEYYVLVPIGDIVRIER
jgi:hypothetical protein